MRNHEWVSMTDSERGQVISMWLLAADDGGRIPNDSMLVQRLCYMSCEPDLERFIKLGFLDADAKPKAPRRQRDANVTPRRRQRDAPEAETEESSLEGIGAPTGSESSLLEKTATAPPVGAVPTRLPTMDERRESAGAKAERHKEELRAKYGHTRADEIAAIKAVTDPAAVDDETGAGRTAEGARGEGEDGQASDAEPGLELPAGGGGDAEGV